MSTYGIWTLSLISSLRPLGGGGYDTWSEAAYNVQKVFWNKLPVALSAKSASSGLTNAKNVIRIWMFKTRNSHQAGQKNKG